LGQLLSHGKSYVLNLVKDLLGYIFSDFFSKLIRTSGVAVGSSLPLFANDIFLNKNISEMDVALHFKRIVANFLFSPSFLALLFPGLDLPRNG
jgi:hypothetical protein